MSGLKESKGTVTFIVADLKRGFRENIIKYLIMILFTVMSLCILNQTITTHQNIGDVQHGAGFFDFMFYIVQGITEYIPGKSSNFQMPVLWMVMSLMPSFVVCSYAVKDLEGQGMYMLLKNKSRTIWWLSKCIWNVISVTALHFIVWITALIGTALQQEQANSLFQLHKDVCELIMSTTDQNVHLQSELFTSDLNQYFSLAILVVPLVVGLSMSLFQMTVSMFIGPVPSFIVILVIYILSAYFMNPFLLGNYSMLIRSDLVVGTGGMNLITGCVLSVILGIGAIIIGWKHFRGKDIMEGV